MTHNAESDAPRGAFRLEDDGYKRGCWDEHHRDKGVNPYIGRCDHDG